MPELLASKNGFEWSYGRTYSEKATATHSSTLAWKIPWTMERLHFHFSLSCIGEGNGNPLQCSCLENPRDRGAKWAAIYGVTQCWIRLKQLSSSMDILWASQVALVVKTCLPMPELLRDEGWNPGSGRSPEGEHGNPLPIYLPRKPHGQRRLVGCSPKGHTESDTNEVT